jgi:hypothetical protein
MVPRLNEKLKRSIDYLLCSVVASHPPALYVILKKLGVVKAIKVHDPNVSASDDSKDCAAEMETPIADEMKMSSVSGGDNHHQHRQVVVPMVEALVVKGGPTSFDVSPEVLRMLGVVCQSKPAADIVCEVGLLDRLLFILLGEY